MTETIRIATRKSPLALWQAEFVASELAKAHPGLNVELLPMSTRGDKILDTPLAKIGGKGLFLKELEAALLEERADIAVHSLKDVPVDMPEGLELPVIMARENPFDAFVSNQFPSLEDLPQAARVGTSSLRRQAQLKALRPDLEVLDLRGNVNTRLAKLDAGEYDAILLAVAGLKRLGFGERIRAILEPPAWLPAAAQGALGIETRAGDELSLQRIAVLADTQTTVCAAMERAFNRRLGGSCQVPIAAHARQEGDAYFLQGLVASVDGKTVLRGETSAASADAEQAATKLADELLARGADKILADLFSS